MTVQLWTALIAIAATPLGGWLGAKLMRSRYRMEIKTLRADLERKLSEVTTNELSNVREGNDILMRQIVEPLRIEVEGLRRDVGRFRLAIEKIPACAFSEQCPVSEQLRKSEPGKTKRDEKDNNPSAD